MFARRYESTKLPGATVQWANEVGMSVNHSQ